MKNVRRTARITSSVTMATALAMIAVPALAAADISGEASNMVQQISNLLNGILIVAGLGFSTYTAVKMWMAKRHGDSGDGSEMVSIVGGVGLIALGATNVIGNALALLIK